MRDAHLTPESLDALLSEDRTEEENQLLLHHLAVCPDCYHVGGYILDLYRAGSIDLEFSSVDLGLGKSRLEAAALWEELSQHPAEEQFQLVGTERFRSWGLCELVCDRGVEEASHDAAVALRFAELAVAISREIQEWEPAEPGWLGLLRGYALAHLANARRVSGNLSDAAAAFKEADEVWQPALKDLGNVLGYETRYLALKASLRREQRQFGEALDLLDLARSATNDPELRAKLMLGTAQVLEKLGAFSDATETLVEAAAELQGREPGRLTLCIEHNLLWLLVTSGRFLEARLRLPRVEVLSQKFGNSLDQIRLDWVHAGIATGLDDLREGGQLLEKVRRRFEEEGIGLDAALASLELAVVRVREGRNEEALQIAAEMYPVFVANQVSEEALGVLLLFRQALEGNRLTVKLAKQVLSRVREITSGSIVRTESSACE